MPKTHRGNSKSKYMNRIAAQLGLRYPRQRCRRDETLLPRPLTFWGALVTVAHGFRTCSRIAKRSASRCADRHPGRRRPRTRLRGHNHRTEEKFRHGRELHSRGTIVVPDCGRVARFLQDLFEIVETPRVGCGACRPLAAATNAATLVSRRIAPAKGFYRHHRTCQRPVRTAWPLARGVIPHV